MSYRFHSRRNSLAALAALVALLLAACAAPAPAPAPTPLPPTATPDLYAEIATRAAVLPSTPTARPEETAEALSGRIAPPYSVPASCAVSSMTVGERRRGYPAYWLDGNSLAAGNPLGNYYAGGNKVQWHPRQMGPYTQNDAITFSGTRLDADAPPAELRNPQNLGIGYGSSVYFPSPGCWRMHGAVGSQTLDATVYVFEAGCSPAQPPGESSLPCGRPPAAPTPTAQAVTGACPVTQPPNPPLVPPRLSPETNPGTGGFWYGNDALWLTMSNSGRMLQSDKAYIWRLLPGPLSVSGRRLDAFAAPLIVNIPDGYGDIGGQSTGFNFPTTGCWEIAAQVSGQELRFVVNVVPNPDFAATATAMAASPATVPPLAAVAVTPAALVNWEQLHRPWQTPMLAAGASCPVTPRKDIAPRAFAAGGGRGPVYAIGYGDVTLSAGAVTPSLLKTLWVAHTSYAGPVLIRGRQLDGPGTLAFQQGVPGTPEPELRLNASRASSANAGEWRQWPSLTVAPGPGCYAFQMDGEGFTDTIVFAVQA